MEKRENRGRKIHGEKCKMKKSFEERKRMKREEEGKELRSLRKEADMWKYISRKRDRRNKVENNIEEEEWREYFKKLLGGIEERNVEKVEMREENRTEKLEEPKKE